MQISFNFEDILVSSSNPNEVVYIKGLFTYDELGNKSTGGFEYQPGQGQTPALHLLEGQDPVQAAEQYVQQVIITPNNQLTGHHTGFLQLRQFLKTLKPATIELAREKKQNEIRQWFAENANTPVTSSSGIVWDGGFDSAIKLDAAKRLSEAAGLNTVIFYDVENVARTLSLEAATQVILEVSVAFQSTLARKQALSRQVAEAGTVEAVMAVTVGPAA